MSLADGESCRAQLTPLVDGESAELAQLREEVASWYAEHVPGDWRELMAGATEREYVDFQRWWLGELRGAGFAAPHWSGRWTGVDYDLVQRVVLAEEEARAGAPRLDLYFTGLYHAYATLTEAGTEAQRQRFLPRVLDGEVWCQAFSEPGAGSDLAALRTRARREGDVFVLNGQKIWSSHAIKSDYGLLLALTDPEAPPRRGISYLIIDMRSEGLEIRPIRQITGEEEFCEIFLDDVEVPVENLIGPENEGWRVALTTLSAERSITLLDLSERLRISVRQLARETIAAGGGSADARMQHLADLYADAEVLSLLNQRVARNRAREVEDQRLESILKLFYAELLQRVGDFGVEVDGLDAHLEQPSVSGARYESGIWMDDYLNSWSMTIGGGTNEIQKNIIAERVLGLPRDPMPSKDAKRGW